MTKLNLYYFLPNLDHKPVGDSMNPLFLLLSV